jgi:hypothetical protein
MSIEFLPFDVDRCSISDARIGRLGPGRRRKKPVSARRLAANRRNAKRSTGPRTARGKRRSSRNALKHGLCAPFERLPTECGATFNTFLEELREEMQPRTAVQVHLFHQIANLMWRLLRLPEAQGKIYSRELQHCGRAGGADGKGELLSPADVLARRFSDDPTRNGFLLLDRYERGTRSSMLRLMRQFESLKKIRPTTPYPTGDDGRVPREGTEPAWDDEKQRRQEELFARRREELPLHVPPRNAREAGVDHAIRACAEPRAERTQSNPPETRDPERPSRNSGAKCSSAGAKRTQSRRDATKSARRQRGQV